MGQMLSCRAMLRRLLRLFKKTSIVIPGAEQLEKGVGRTVQLGDGLQGGTQILICRTMDGEVHALDTECPHGEGGRLIAGPLASNKYAVCPLHNFQFDPKSGRVERGACRSARRFKITEVGGEFRITV